MELIAFEVLSEASACLRTLAHPIRLRMLEMLFAGEFSVGELAEACGIPPHMASEHLGKMKDRGLLRCERKGRFIYYSVAKPGLKGILDCIESNFGGRKELWS